MVPTNYGWLKSCAACCCSCLHQNRSDIPYAQYPVPPYALLNPTLAAVGFVVTGYLTLERNTGRKAKAFMYVQVYEGVSRSIHPFDGNLRFTHVLVQDSGPVRAVQGLGLGHGCR